jgi:hypothetical protein
VIPKPEVKPGDASTQYGSIRTSTGKADVLPDWIDARGVAGVARSLFGMGAQSPRYAPLVHLAGSAALSPTMRWSRAAMQVP